MGAKVSDDGSGSWKACLKPTAAGGDFTLTATCTGCTNKTPAVLEHVTFGDVWYCAGQSNMALSMLHSFNRNKTRDAIVAGKYANIRIHGMEGNMNPPQPWATLQQAQATTPLPKSKSKSNFESNSNSKSNSKFDEFAQVVWMGDGDGGTVSVSVSGCTPGCAPGTNCSSDCSSLMGFSAACYYFGESLTDMMLEQNGEAPPIGLIHTAWGGSSIEQWLANDTIETCEYVDMMGVLE